MDFIEHIVSLAHSRTQRTIVGITGPPGAGKSTTAHSLVDALNSGTDLKAAYVPVDGFHLSNEILSRHGLSGSKGAPETFDVQGFVALLDRVVGARSTVYVPDYDRRLHQPVAARWCVRPDDRVVVVEGNYLGLADGGWEGVRSRLTQLWYLDTPEYELQRRLVNRQIDGGASPAAARDWYLGVDAKSIALVAGTKGAADWIVSDQRELPDL